MLLFGVVVLMMFIGRVAFKKLAMLLGGLALVGCLGAVFLLAIPKDTDIPFLHRFDTWKSRITNFTEKEEVPAAKFDIDKDAQIAHARIAIATSNVIGKAPGNSIQRDFLTRHSPISSLPLSLKSWAGRRRLCSHTLHLAIGPDRPNRPKVRTYIPGIPRHGYCLDVGITSHIEHDGSRRTISCNRTTFTANQ